MAGIGLAVRFTWISSLSLRHYYICFLGWKPWHRAVNYLPGLQLLSVRNWVCTRACWLKGSDMILLTVKDGSFSGVYLSTVCHTAHPMQAPVRICWRKEFSCPWESKRGVEAEDWGLILLDVFLPTFQFHAPELYITTHDEKSPRYLEQSLLYAEQLNPPQESKDKWLPCRVTLAGLGGNMVHISYDFP